MSLSKRKAPASEPRRVAAKTSACNNHCFSSDIQLLDGSTKRKGSYDRSLNEGLRKSPRQETRLLSRDKKLIIFKEMFHWKTKGGESPVGRLVKEFGVHRNTPKKILDKVVKKGSVDNQWHVQGRPPEFGEEVWEKMVEIIRDYREAHLTAPARLIRSDLLRSFNDAAPSVTTIRRKKAFLEKDTRRSDQGDGPRSSHHRD
jgi:hypothetical protein